MTHDIKSTDIQVIAMGGYLAFWLKEGKIDCTTFQFSQDAVEQFTAPIAEQHSCFEIIRDEQTIAAYQLGEAGTWHEDNSFLLTNDFRSSASQHSIPEMFSETAPLSAKFFKAGDIVRLYSRDIDQGQFLELNDKVRKTKWAHASNPDLSLTK